MNDYCSALLPKLTAIHKRTAVKGHSNSRLFQTKHSSIISVSPGDFAHFPRTFV